MSGQTYLRVLVGVKRWRSVQTCALLSFDRPTGTAAKSFSPFHIRIQMLQHCFLHSMIHL